MARKKSLIYKRGDSSYYWAWIYVKDPLTGKRKRKNLSTQTDDRQLAVDIQKRFQAEADAAAIERSGANDHFTREKAEEMVNLLLTWHGLGALVGARSTISWQEYSEKWCVDLDLTSVRASTKRDYKSHVARFTAWLEKTVTNGEKIPLKTIDREMIQDFYRYLLVDQGLQPKTIQNRIKGLRMIFAQAIDDDLLTKNPAARIRVAKKVKTRQKEPFTEEDLQSMFTLVRSDEIEHGDEWETAMLFGLCIGARLADCVHRDWSQVHIEEDRATPFIKYIPEKTAHHEKELTVPIEEPLLSHLRGLSQDLGHPRQGMITPNLGRQTVNWRDGLSSQFGKIIEKAEIPLTVIPPEEGTRGITWRSKGFHSFRATLPSLMAKAEVPPEIRMKIIGHSQMETHKLYTHLEDQQMRQALKSALSEIDLEGS